MQKIYKRADLVITAFDIEDVITTSIVNPPPTTPPTPPEPPAPAPVPEDPIHTDYGQGSPDVPFGAWW